MTDSNVGGALILTIVLIAINGILASAEIAMMGLNEAKLRAKANTGDKKSKVLLHMKETPSNFLSTIQIGITLAGLLSGAFAADSLAKPIVSWASAYGITGIWLTVIQSSATLLITLLMTYFMLVFGELVPKQIAIANPEKTARLAIIPINILSKITRPLVFLLSASSSLVLRMIGVDPTKGESITEEDVLLMMREGQEQGEIEEVEMQVVSNLFEFTDLRVEDAMTHRTEIKALPIDSTLSDVATMVSETGFNKFPVIDGNLDHIVGILYSKDTVPLFPSLQSSNPAPSIKDCIRHPHFVPESKMLVELFSEMKLSGERMAVVVDEYGGTSGIITLMDILEEIVGELEIPQSRYIVELDNGSYLVNGRTEIKDVGKLLELPDIGEKGATLSSFLIHELDYVPKKGEHPFIHLSSYVIRVEEVKGGFIHSASIRKEKPTDSPEP